MKFKRHGFFAVALSVAALCGACGGQNNESASTLKSDYDCAHPNADQTTAVTVAALPILSTGAVYAGIEEGFFTKNGLEVTVNPVPTIAGSISALQGGSADFAFASTVQMFQALQNGVPIVAVAPFAGIAPDYWDKMQAGEKGYTTEITALLAREDSGIDNPGDLDGKTVAITDVEGQSELTTRIVMQLHGGDPSTVKFVTMAPADSYNALLAGQVDAAASIAPSFDGYEDKGVEVLSWIGVEALHEGPTSFFVASKSAVAKDPEVTARFNCALREATDFGNKNPDAIRQLAARAQNVDPATLASATVPYYYSSTDLAGLDRFEKIMEDSGFLKDRIEPSSVIIPAALEAD